MLSMAIKDRIIALELRGPSERELGWLLGGRDGRLLVVAILAVAGQPAVALAVTGATSLVTSGIRVALTRRPKAGLP
jgi:hypothetical protein